MQFLEYYVENIHSINIHSYKLLLDTVLDIGVRKPEDTSLEVLVKKTQIFNNDCNVCYKQIMVPSKPKKGR